MSTNQPAPPIEEGVHGDGRTISLVGLAHGTSHFFHLLLPPLFPMLASQYGFSYAELGFLVTVFFIVSGVGQALAGFVVDRTGALPVLLAAMVAFTLAGLSAALAQGYTGFVIAAALAGLGNAPFHPADFTILNQRVSPPRLGHAFSVHGISGNVGWAAAPVVIAAVSAGTGSWRWAMVACAALAACVGLLLWSQSRVLRTTPAPEASPARVGAGSSGPPIAAQSAASTFAFLKLPSVWVCFLFFFWSTCALTAVQSFIGPAMSRLYGQDLPGLAMMVTAYMLFSAVGMVLGGFWVKRPGRLERNIGLALLASAALMGIAGSGWLNPVLAAGLVALAGLGTGLAGPSRDMLIRKATPPGATGRVYGTVYSGLDVGFAAAAPVFGAMLDHGGSSTVFMGAAIALILGVLSATWVGRRVRI